MREPTHDRNNRGNQAGNQGEGDKDADRRYRERTDHFLKSKRGQAELKEVKKHAGDLSDEERRELERAEDEGRKRAKEIDRQDTMDL